MVFVKTYWTLTPSLTVKCRSPISSIFLLCGMWNYKPLSLFLQSANSCAHRVFYGGVSFLLFFQSHWGDSLSSLLFFLTLYIRVFCFFYKYKAQYFWNVLFSNYLLLTASLHCNSTSSISPWSHTLNFFF